MDRRILIFILSLAILALGYTAYTGLFALKNPRELIDVSRVIDGDTIELTDGRRVRLLGVNAPENNENFYKESAEYLEKLIAGKQIGLEAFGKDKYGRTLGYLYLDNMLINLELVKNGFAHVYFLSPDEKFYLEFKKSEKDAKDKNFGIWKSATNNCISIINFRSNAQGNDNENLNDEYVVFRNRCDTPTDLSKWEIKDEGTSIYIFKTFRVLPNNEFTIYSGSGKDSDDALYWNSKRAIWNNDKDTLFLRDTEGNLVLSYSYPN